MQIFTCFVLTVAMLGQPTSDSPLAPPPDGPRHADPTYHVLINATLHPAPGEVITMGAIAIKDGRIVQVHSPVHAEAFIHDGARVWDCEGLHIYPGFIDPYVAVDAPPPAGDPAALHWNERVIPQRRATDGNGLSARDAEALRKLGFVAAGLSPDDGIFRGRAGVVSLAEGYDDESKGDVPVYRDDVYQTIAFSAGGLGGGYPNSQMGTIALIRQTLSDADWQTATGNDLAPNALDALGRDVPLVVVTRDELEALRAGKIAREFERDMIIVGSGEEYQRLDAIVADGHPIILPLDFPDTPTVDTIGAEDSVELATLMAWEHAPYNPRRLDEAGTAVALTTSGGRREFMPNLRTAIEHGLPEERALAMLTTTPASLLGVEDHLGALRTNTVASFIVTDGPIFDKKTKIRDVWVDGRRHTFNDAPEADITGTWNVNFAADDAPDGLEIRIASGNKITVHKADEEPLEARKVKRSGNMLSYIVDDPDGAVLVSTVIDGDEMEGTLRTADGNTMAWSARRMEAGVDEPEAELPVDPIAGLWEMTAFNEDAFGPDGVPYTLDITRDGDQFNVDFQTEPIVATVSNVTFDDGLLQATLTDTQGGEYRLAALIIGDTAQGEVSLPVQGVAADTLGARTETRVAQRDDNEPEDAKADPMPKLPGYPFGPYAITEQPEQRRVIFTNATIWTSGPDGIIENGYVAIEDGRIARVGRGPVAANGVVEVIDLQGKHITPGIIDCHSHTGISRGINESGQAVTAEVRIQDVTDPDTVHWYRQLAGGVTAVNSLHGSANPIGGQSQTNKVRWGVTHPDRMHMEGATPGIKFALGENVKQSNWSNPTNRYPQTRMGVETLIRDRFIAAREYAREREAYEHVMEEVAVLERTRQGTDVNQTEHFNGQILREAEEGQLRRILISDSIDTDLRTHGSLTIRDDKDADDRPSLLTMGRGFASEPDLGVHGRLPEHSKSTDEVDVIGKLRVRYLGDDEAFPRDDAESFTEGLTIRRNDPGRAAWTDTQSVQVTDDGAVFEEATPHRRDLELEALAEILAGERLIHCHSYRQDEILMLCRIAEEFGFTIGSFQHVLEGYKVAEAIKENALGGSAFSDWWAFKVEVQDAIPHNGAIMHEVGVNVSFNSDSNELARRLNTEAAKAVRYGGVEPAEALKFITLNPAIQLGVDDRIGSIEVGKDADLAIWSGNPLSTLSICEQTWVDGRRYFCLDTDAEHRERNAAERRRLIQKILAEGKPESRSARRPDAPEGDEATNLVDTPPHRMTIANWRYLQTMEAIKRHNLDLIQRGLNPADHRCGDCGTSLSDMFANEY